MFMFRASAFLAELERLAPTMLAACQQALAAGHADTDFLWLDREAFAACPKDSIDYAVMEKTDRAVVMPLDGGLERCRFLVGAVGRGRTRCRRQHPARRRDRGRYPRYLRRRRHAAGRHGRGERSGGGRDRRRRAGRHQGAGAGRQDGGRPAQGQPASGRASPPQGVSALGLSTTRIDFDQRFQVKRITVKPGACISSQMHHHRAEHWVVVSGTARVTAGDEVFLLTENQSTYIPVGVQHRLDESRQDSAGNHRGAIGQLSGRGRHRPLRGCVRPRQRRDVSATMTFLN